MLLSSRKRIFHILNITELQHGPVFPPVHYPIYSYPLHYIYRQSFCFIEAVNTQIR